MGLFSFLNKKKRESVSRDETFYSYSENHQGQAHDAKPLTGKRKKEMAASENEGSLIEKKRARRRLVGAIALVLTLAIGLPMILDTNPKPLIEDITIQIPSKEKLSNGTDSLTNLPNENPSNVNIATEKIKGSTEPKESKELLASIPQSINVAQSTPEKMPITESAVLQRTDNEITESKKEQFIIQVAALASAKKVHALQGKLKNVGLPSHIQKIATQSGERIRVRLGPFNRAEADKTQSKLIKLGMSGTIIPVKNN